MSKYVKAEDVIELINGLESLPWEEETEEMVNRLPAYDLDKVVERLEKEAEECKKDWDEFGDSESFGGVNAFCRAIEIAKEGGMEGNKSRTISINEEQKVSGWIPCSERLPKDTEDEEYYQICLVTLANGDVCLGVYRWDDLEWYTRMSEGEDDYSTIHEVIAWMPLPEPYRKE